MKVGLLLEDQGFDSLDVSRPEEGNPGIGGTAYCFLLLGKFLAEEKDMTVTYYHFRGNRLPNGSEKLVNDISRALLAAKENGEDVLIMKNLQDEKTYHEMEHLGIRVIIWAHNFLTYEEILLFRSCDAVKRVVCVGRQMYDYYLDDPVIAKMDYVFNIFLPPRKELPRKRHYDRNVTYIGSLVFEKNFHVLAAAWKDIVAAVPEAKLHVIGSGKLYSRENALGVYGIAGKEYEEIFFPPLLDEDGRLMRSVVFHGLLGDDKYHIFENTAVGVVNPMAATETFCLCAVEMESCGIPVVTRKKNGLLDTVIDRKTGLLYKNPNKLAKYVICLLRDDSRNAKLGEQAKQYAQEMFLPKKVIPEWKRVLFEVADGRQAGFHPPKEHFGNNGKWLRYALYVLRKISFLRKMPSIHDIQKK